PGVNRLNVESALEMHDAANANEAHDLYLRMPPDVILLDWEMPGMSGIELTRLIRSSEKGPNRFIPIVMLSGYSVREQVIEARDAGVTEFLCKPVSAKALYKRIVSMITEPRPFVSSSTFFGPDRRRFVHPQYEGKERRIKTANAIKIPGFLLVERHCHK
ncbi:MAG: response regulator, partial [Eubacteriales bacterium]